jgi:cobalt-zinc-cadmium efflux system protein
VNLRAAYLHLAGDAAVSAGVVITGLAIRATGWSWLDPLTSLLIAVVIVLATLGILRQSLGLAMNAVPEGIDRAAVEAYLAKLPGVIAVHDLHIWALSTTDSALTAHVVRPGEGPDDEFLRGVAAELRARFRIGHSTIQVEHDGADCHLAPAEVI